jgi:uncharacterized protein (TIGR02118 family)
MLHVAVMYPKTADSTFDLEYYLTKHVPMVKERLASSGLTAVQVDEGLGGGVPGDPPAYAVIGALLFDSMEGMQSGMAAHGGEIMGDLANFTNVLPTIQVSRVRS